MKIMKAITFTLISIFIITSAVSCKKYRKYDNMEVIENTFTGNVIIESTGSDPGGDFTGDGDSGTYSFVWDNSKKKAELNYDITTAAGSVQITLKDSRDNEVLNQTRTAGSGDDSFSGTSEKGKKGKWLVTIKFTNFDGDGSFSISPVD